MIAGILFSEDFPSCDFTEAAAHKLNFGPKGAMLAALPRPWTPPFALIPASLFAGRIGNGDELLRLDEKIVARLSALSDADGKLIVRSSVLGETIWDRGSYKSVVIPSKPVGFRIEISNAATEVLSSAYPKPSGLVVQRYIEPRSRGEFGNLLRVSKTRDHWELTTETTDGATSRVRFNTQRDEAASPSRPLEIRSRQARERLFGSAAAWLNNELLRGRSQRLNCEWLTDNQEVYLVQLDEEDEDFAGINPFQVPVPAAHHPIAAKGTFLMHADQASLSTWDKLKVLDELWEPEAAHKPTLFYVPLSALPKQADNTAKSKLERDFAALIGADNVIVRTSVRAGSEKPPNLPRTECVLPRQAASWCFDRQAEFRLQGRDVSALSFVTHRFIASRASAWVRAHPDNPLVEIHSLWGLPDALQYCPYDIWEVHVPTEVATEYPEYKSHMLIARTNGGWEYVRIKNELARHISIGRQEAIDLAARTLAIAQRLGRACHVMWFVGCVDSDGQRFNLPWYWTEAHEADRNPDRLNYKVIMIADESSLAAFRNFSGSRSRLAIELRPTDLELMRDTAFIEAAGETAKAFDVPVILSGSTLAHAYYQLRRLGCTVVTPGEKEHSRVRHAANLGKLVRDKIPERIIQRQEAEVTRKLPDELVKGFLTSKLFEEAMEVRGAENETQKVIELADLFEVFRALAKVEGVSLDRIVASADEKRKKAGGFDDGLVLLQTGILGRDGQLMQGGDRPLTQVLARKISDDTYEIPFSFFGFMELDQPRSLSFEQFGIKMQISLKSDRLEVRLSKEAEQFELPLDRAIGSADVQGSIAEPPVKPPSSKTEK
jgi:predicted house-cleaning noncanonical NTP pyrophosphatase (MazG superfamily)